MQRFLHRFFAEQKAVVKIQFCWIAARAENDTEGDKVLSEACRFLWIRDATRNLRKTREKKRWAESKRDEQRVKERKRSKEQRNGISSYSESISYCKNSEFLSGTAGRRYQMSERQFSKNSFKLKNSKLFFSRNTQWAEFFKKVISFSYLSFFYWNQNRQQLRFCLCSASDIFRKAQNLLENYEKELIDKKDMPHSIADRRERSWQNGRKDNIFKRKLKWIFIWKQSKGDIKRLIEVSRIIGHQLKEHDITEIRSSKSIQWQNESYTPCIYKGLRTQLHILITCTFFEASNET